MDGVRAYARELAELVVAALDPGDEAAALGGAVPDARGGDPRWGHEEDAAEASGPRTSRKAWAHFVEKARPALHRAVTAMARLAALGPDADARPAREHRRPRLRRGAGALRGGEEGEGVHLVHPPTTTPRPRSRSARGFEKKYPGVKCKPTCASSMAGVLGDRKGDPVTPFEPGCGKGPGQPVDTALQLSVGVSPLPVDHGRAIGEDGGAAAEGS